MTDAPLQSPAPAAETRWTVVLLAVSAGIVVAFQIGKLPSAIPALQSALSLSLVEAGWVLSLVYAVAAAIGAVTGVCADRWGVRRMALVGLMATGAGTLTGGLSDGLTMLLASRLLEGLGAVTVLVASPALILRATTRRHLGLAMGFWGTFMPTGIAIMILLTPPLLSLGGWRGLWIANAALVWLFATGFWWGTRKTPDGASMARGIPSPWAELAAVLRRAGPWLLALLFSIYAAAFLPITAFLPKYLIETYRYDPGSAAIFVAIIIWANAAGNLTGGWLGHRGAPRWLLIAIALLTMGVTGWLTYADGFGVVARLFFALTFSYVGGLLPASVFGSVTRHAPDRSRIAGMNGLILQGTNIGQLASPPLFALLVAMGGWAQGPWLTVVLCAAGILFAVLLRRVEHRRCAAGDPVGPS